MKAVYNRLVIDLVDIKNYLRIQNDEDNAFLTELADAAKQQADLYLNNDFIEFNEVGEEVEIPIPISIKIAVLKIIAFWYENRVDKVSSENVGGHSITYGDIPPESEKLLFPFKKLVGL